MKAGYAKVTVGGACYLYDTATNAIVPVTAAVHAVLEDYLRSGASAVLRKFAARWPGEELRQAVDFLGACRERGLLQPMRRLDFLPGTEAGHLRRLYAQGLQRMTLDITERCNQRCRYCPYGGASRGVRRGRDMDGETARRSIDYLLAHAAGATTPTLELFGGEPLRNWPVVRQSILYLRQDLQRHDVEIVLCTNATLLERDRMEFLMAHRVVLQVSLDGPATIHDRARVLADGRGTHADVLRALRRIRRRDPAYFRACVRPHCTFSLESDLLEVFTYFSRPMFRDLQVGFAYRAGAFRVPPAVRARHERQLDELTERHSRALRQRRPFNRALFAQIVGSGLGTLELRRVGGADAKPAPNSACVPGQTRIFVSGSGAFFPCENFNRPGGQIGDCQRGLVFPLARNLLRSYARLCNRLCQGCWAWRLCAHCFIHAGDRNGQLSPARKGVSCRREREGIVRALHRYIALRGGPARPSRGPHPRRDAPQRRRPGP